MLWVVVCISLFLHQTTSCPNSCICYQQTIDCSSRLLPSLPQFLQSGSLDYPVTKTAFTSLILANNMIKELPTLSLSDSLPHLQKLDLSNNEISKLTNIQSIVLNKRLLHLKLSSNPLRSLGYDTDTVLYSQSVSHLDLSKCAINSITHQVTFTYMLNLTYITLSGNPLIVVDHLASSSLSHLDLSYCLLGLSDKGIREEAFLELSNLKFLNISANSHMTRLATAKTLSSSLLQLEATYCALENLNLNCFPNLQQATLKGNLIKVLQNNALTKNTHLQHLDISENSIHHIELGAFVGSESLQQIDLSMNFISELNWDVFTHAPHLQAINISRNLLTSLGEIPVPSLQNLDASKCEILKISPRFMEKTEDLIYLNLSHNSLEALPKKLSSTKLISLDLSYCRISDLKESTFQGLSSLTSLNLVGNRLTSPLKEGLLQHLVNMKELKLENNPWNCDCGDNDFKKLWEYLSSVSINSKNLKHLTCQSPKEHSGLSWANSCFNNLTTSREILSKNKVWYSFMVPFIVLSCLLAVLFGIRQVYSVHREEVQQREQTSQESRTRSSNYLPRLPAHFFDTDLERGIQMSVNESTQRSQIRELSKLPSYEEALLLPKPQSREDLQKIVKKYEDGDRFEQSMDISQQLQNNTLTREDTNDSNTSPANSPEMEDCVIQPCTSSGQ